MKRDDKKAQFFLIATFVVVILITGIAVLMNYSRAESYTKVNELKKELKIESEYVLDYGIYNEENMNTFLEDFTDDFAEYAGEDLILYFIFGEEGSLKGRKYEEGSGETFIVSESGGKAILEAEGGEYSFDLNPGQNFHYVIIQSISGEKYVAASQ